MLPSGGRAGTHIRSQERPLQPLYVAVVLPRGTLSRWGHHTGIEWWGQRCCLTPPAPCAWVTLRRMI